MRFFILLLFFTFSQVSGQSWYIKRNIDWMFQDIASPALSVREITAFRFAVYNAEETSLPYFSEVIEWDPEHRNVNVRFFSATYEPIPDHYSVHDVFSDLPGIITINHDISVENRKPFLIVNFLPFRRNPETGKAERLKSFVLEVVSDPVNKIFSQEKKSDISVNSVLSSGEWYKIRISSTGIFKLTFEQLRDIGLSDPASVRIFGYGGKVLPEDIRTGIKDDLMPVQIYMNKGTDNVFGANDYILFYGTGTDTWQFDNITQMFRCTRNPYSDHAYYFLTCKNGSADLPVSYTAPEGEISFNTDIYDHYSHHELYLRNLIKSGKKWYGEEFDLLTQHIIDFKVPGLITSEPLMLLTNVLSRAKDTASFILGVNGSDIETFRVRPVNLSDYTGIYAYNLQKRNYFNSSSENISVRLRYIKSDPTAKGWLDFVTLNAKAKILLTSDQLLIRNYESVLSGGISKFKAGNADNNTIVWDVTDPDNIMQITTTLQSSDLYFVSETGILREYLIFRANGSFPSPDFTGEGLGKIDNQNLHGINVPDLVIITHKDFQTEAERLARHRSEKNGLDIIVTTPEKIYNEFSAGTPDVTAIRNFIFMLYWKEGYAGKLRNLLFFGDGSYDNKGINANPGNYLPTYQSDNSLSPVLSFLSDDYFALLDPGEQMLTGLLDIGVGRLPVSKSSQAAIVVDKIIEYENPSSMGTWRNSVTFIGDDEDNNIHMQQANQLAEYVNSNYPSFNVNKVYLDAYKQITTPVGQRYPDVNRAINDQVTRGALIINYTGHGGTDGLAHEKILSLNDITSWSNKGKYPLFMTATCDFSRFDDFERVTAGEETILNPSGGGIALFTTTRLVYSGPNHALNERFYEIVFEKDQSGENYDLGSIMKYTKNKTGSGINKRNFTLLGDPSMRLAYPGLKVITDSINSRSVTIQTDTLKAFSQITITGHIEDYQGNIMDETNGIVFPLLYDKPVQLTTLANDGGTTMNFSYQNSILYNGKASVTNGYFRFSFIIPKDINYSFGNGRLSYYAHNEEGDATGYFKKLVIGGTAESYNPDNNGPQVEVYLNNENFRPGDITHSNPLLYVKVFDESGINTSGNGVGHDITAVLNENTSTLMLLNEYFQADIDNFTGGVVIYPLFNLEEGPHRISVKVWDIYNNSGEGSIEFTVIGTKEIVLNEIFNYPNSFKDNTWFSFGHNKAGSDLEITIDIFDSSGGLVRTIKTKEYGSGFRSEPILWDGKDNAGNYNRQGLYIYRIRVSDSEGQVAEKSGKLLIVR